MSAPACAADRAGCVSATAPAEPAEVPRMRKAIRSFARWVLPGAAADAELIVSELVTNAIEHGRGPVDLTVTHTRGVLRVEVTDRSPAPARLRTVCAEDESGRGLFIVAALADAWGVSPDGTLTWAELRASGRGL